MKKLFGSQSRLATPTTGELKSILHPTKSVIRGVLEHNSIRNLDVNSPNYDAIMREEGKYGSRRVSNKRLEKLFSGAFGSKHKRTEELL